MVANRPCVVRSAALPGLQRPKGTDPNLDHALWKANFRDFGAARRRMATLAPGGRIGTARVQEKRRACKTPSSQPPRRRPACNE